MRPSRTPRNGDVDLAVLLHELEVRGAELEAQNQELITGSEELRRSNSALAVARDHLRALYDLAPAPLVTIDASCQIIDVNRAAEALFRSSRNKLTARPLALFFAESVRIQLRALLNRMFSGAPSRPVDLVLAPDDGGEPVDVRIDGVVFLDDDSTHAVISLVDLTATKRAENERRTLDLRAHDTQRLHSLGVLAGGIAHDFNNLLTVVLSGTDLMLRRLAGSPGLEPLHEVEVAARHAGALAQQMLAYSGIKSAPTRILDLCRLIRDVQELIDTAAGSTPVALDLPEGGGWIRGDETQLRQVVLNLVSNAGEAMVGRAGAIVVAVELDGPTVALEVRDAGVGMDAATQARIFEPYYSTKFVGRGLGLAVVQGVVGGHEGTVTVESEPGRGTTIRVSLPAAPPAVEGRRPSASTPWSGTGTVLLVDDDRMVRRAIERILAELGCEVLVAGDGVEALEVFRTEGERIDLVLMDHAMPNMNGPTAAAAIHRMRAEVPIVLVTGYAEMAADDGSVFVGVLAKPFDIEALHQLMAKYVPSTTTA